MMSVFSNLEDTPIFRKQLYSSENTADELKNRCQKLQKGCKRFIASLGEGCDGGIAFAESLEAFGAGYDDPLSVAIGGPIMSKFTTAFRELATYKELLRSQVEHMLSNRLMEFSNVDLQNAKDSRRRFEKAQVVYDQAREKFMSLKKGTRADVVTELEEDLHNSKSAFERCRFNLVSALANIEAKKKYEFLESISAVMDAHLRYFKQGYELLNQMEPFIHQILTYSQQSKEMTNIEHDNLAKRIQEFRTQEELDISRFSSNTEASTNGDGIHFVGIASYKSIEALMQSTAKGEVQTIKQGYLLKRPTNLRGDLKRRFFVLDSHGTLYYYRNNWNKQSQGSQTQQSASTSEAGSGVFGRFRFSHHRTTSQGEDNLSCRTIDLHTSTIKIDADQTDLRFCFRIISPMKTYTLQAENAAERTDWVDKITAVIASLLNSSILKQPGSQIKGMNGSNASYVSDSLSQKSYNFDFNSDVVEQQNIASVLRNIPGNDVCAECNSCEPDWASLNLGILLCIECSGVHRNLGVHISKIRSLTLDVKVWETTMLGLFHALGNSYCNSVWEELIQVKNERVNELDPGSLGLNPGVTSITKPGPQDPLSIKEKYIQLKYLKKLLVAKGGNKLPQALAAQIWEAVKTSNIQATYRLLVTSDTNPNTKYDLIGSGDLYHLADVREITEKMHYDPASCLKIKDTGEAADCLQGCTLLHLACHIGDLVMLELLLQFGADINMQDFHGRTPLHHCVFMRNNVLAKYLIKRGARSTIKDGGGQTALERAMEFGPITDEELFILLVESQ